MKRLPLPIVLIISVGAGLIMIACGKCLQAPYRYSPPVQYGPNDTAPACADTPHRAGTNPCNPNDTATGISPTGQSDGAYMLGVSSPRPIKLMPPKVLGEINDSVVVLFEGTNTSQTIMLIPATAVDSLLLQEMEVYDLKHEAR